MTRWEEALWDEVDALPPATQFAVLGEYITYITQTLLTAMGERRRAAVLAALDGEDMDATKFAEMVGTRPTTITRLAEEARANARKRAAAA